jgi:hypothetical protein
VGLAPGSSETSVLTRVTRRNNQKTPFFIVTAVKTSNLTLYIVEFEIKRQYETELGTEKPKLITFYYLRRMASSGMLRRVAVVGIDVSQDLTLQSVFLRSVRRLLVTANVFPSSPILAI